MNFAPVALWFGKTESWTGAVPVPNYEVLSAVLPCALTSSLASAFYPALMFPFIFHLMHFCRLPWVFNGKRQDVNPKRAVKSSRCTVQTKGDANEC